MHTPPKILIIQTAFIGDVILATGLIEKLSQHFQDADIDILVRKGNESLLENNPHIKKVLIWDKKSGKLKNLFRILRQIRQNKYDFVINAHRFASSGILAGFSGSKNRIGFNKNPLSFLFTQKVEHKIGSTHEIERNHLLLSGILPAKDPDPGKPRLYPSGSDEDFIAKWKSQTPYITISPASVWFTKQFPAGKWVDFLNRLPAGIHVFMLGGKGDKELTDSIINNVTSNKNRIENLCGQLSFLQSGALMRAARMNYVNDSAPLHICSAVNAPVAAIFCSTVPEFGFTPLSDNSALIQVETKLACRPCGLHGKRECPEGHFNCAMQIDINRLLSFVSN